jgi:hypothetical protein
MSSIAIVTFRLAFSWIYNGMPSPFNHWLLEVAIFVKTLT